MSDVSTSLVEITADPIARTSQRQPGADRVKQDGVHSLTGKASDFALMAAVFAGAYLAMAFGDTFLLAPSRAVAAEMQDQGLLDWTGAAAHLAQFDASD